MADRVNRVSDVRYEMKAVIEFLNRKGRTPKEIFLRLKNIYGDQVFDISMVRYWACKSKRNWIQLTDRDCPGSPERRNSTEISQKIDEKNLQKSSNHAASPLRIAWYWARYCEQL